MKPRRWRRPLSSAVDAYCMMLRMSDDLAKRAMSLTSLQKLANICPPCFGPLIDSPCPSEPDYIVCVDGSFQHQRHTASSQEWTANAPTYPPLFLPPKEVQAWKDKVQHNVALVSGINTIPINPLKNLSRVEDECCTIRTLAHSSTLPPLIRGHPQLGEGVTKPVLLGWPVATTSV